MHTGILIILALHTTAALICLIAAFRDRLGSSESFRWGAIGFITGILGLINRARMDRRHVHYMQLVQDALLNLGLELIAVVGVPYFLK
jgi:nitrate reductase gamma subunit